MTGIESDDSIIAVPVPATPHNRSTRALSLTESSAHDLEDGAGDEARGSATIIKATDEHQASSHRPFSHPRRARSHPTQLITRTNSATTDSTAPACECPILSRHIGQPNEPHTPRRGSLLGANLPVVEPQNQSLRRMERLFVPFTSEAEYLSVSPVIPIFMGPVNNRSWLIIIALI